MRILRKFSDKAMRRLNDEKYCVKTKDENKNPVFREEKSTIRPLVSVCISVYNGEDHLRKCLDSVLSQNISSMEIVLVNDGSTDDTSEIMHEYQNRFPEIRIIEQENRGLAQGRWTGVKNSSGSPVEVALPFWIRMIIFLKVLIKQYFSSWKTTRLTYMSSRQSGRAYYGYISEPRE